MAELKDVRTYQLNLSLVEPVAESCAGFSSEGACLLTTCIDVTLAGDEFIKGLTRKINRLLDEQLFVRKHYQEFITAFVNKWSAGCQVFARSAEYADFMKLCKGALAEWGDTFSYTLMRESSLSS